MFGPTFGNVEANIPRSTTTDDAAAAAADPTPADIKRDPSSTASLPPLPPSPPQGSIKHEAVLAQQQQQQQAALLHPQRPDLHDAQSQLSSLNIAQTPPIKPESTVGAQPSASDVVDLTEDDVEERIPMSGNGTRAAPFVPLKQDPFGAAPTYHLAHMQQQQQQQQQHTQYGSFAGATGLPHQDDPITSALVDTYVRVSDHMAEMDAEIQRLSAQMGRLLVENMQHAMEVSTTIQQLNLRLTEEQTNRHATVAKVLVHLWQQEQRDIGALVAATAGVDIPHAQHACHAKCASIEQALRDKRNVIAQTKQTLEETVFMKPGASSTHEMARLAGAITDEETAIAKLNADRLEEFKRLLHLSQQVRDGVRSAARTGFAAP